VQKTVEAKLNKLDERVRDLTKEANDPKVKPTVATSAKQQLSTAEAEIKRLRTDPHAPSEARASIVRNMDPWYAAFKVQPGQKLYLAPADRVRIW